ncbi:thiol-dependent ubiquitin-specific protease [Aureococcus anophagefferens]|nr:thiol-dependent ubiquitin-specific protease [Aureococcus anophagefferens]
MSVVADDDAGFRAVRSDDDESSRRPPSSRGGGGASDDSDSSASSGSDASSVGSVASVSSRLQPSGARAAEPAGSATAKRKGSFMGGGGPAPAAPRARSAAASRPSPRPGRARGRSGSVNLPGGGGPRGSRLGAGGRRPTAGAVTGAVKRSGSRTGASPSPAGAGRSRGESGESDDGQQRARSPAGSRQNLSRQGSRQNIGSVTGNTNVLIHRIGDGPPEAVVEKMTLVEVRSKMKIALLCDRIQYAVERHVVLQPEAVQGATHLRERADCEEFVERYRLWRGADAARTPTAAAPTRPTSAARARSSRTGRARAAVLGVREFVFMMKDLGLVSRTLTLSDVARTLVSVCSFTGEPKLDKLDQDDFALFYCAEATFDGPSPRRTASSASPHFLAIKTQTTVQMLWDQCDALAGFH